MKIPSAAQSKADRIARRRCGHFLALLPALLFGACFGSEHGSVGESRPGDAYATLGMDVADPDDIGNASSYEWNVVGSHLPTGPNSRQPRISLGKVTVNDTNPGMGTYPREQVGSEYIFWSCDIGIFPLGRLSSQPLRKLVYPFTFQGSGSIPSCSPFTFLVMLQMYLYFTLSWWTKRHCFLHRSNFLLLLCSSAVIPVCAHYSDRQLRTRLLYPLQSCSSFTWRSVAQVVPRTPFDYYRRGASGSGLEWMTIFEPGGYFPPLAPRLKYGGCSQYVLSCHALIFFLPWDKLSRVGEASNPGPVVKFSTLNIVSAGKNQQVMLEEQAVPSIQVYTETCMTKAIQESLLRKTRRCKQTMVSGALCNPRQNIIRGASYTRGQSGGVF